MPRRDRPEVFERDRLESPLSALEPLSPRRHSRSRLNPMLMIGGLTLAAGLGLTWVHIKAYWQSDISDSKALALPTRPIARPALPVSSPSVQLEPASTSAQPQPSADCLAGGTVIDDEVLRCRFGEVPRPRVEAQPRQGMVSAAYLEQYRAKRAARPVGERRAHNNGTENQLIPGWDGRGTYRAAWDVVDNEVDASSVCRNHRQGSIHYRECRKAAKQWFKDQCWAAQNRESSNDAARRRYCSAAASLNPMG